MKPPTSFFEFLCIGMGISAVALFGFLNDKTKERAVREAEREGRTPDARLLNYKNTKRDLLWWLIGPPVFSVGLWLLLSIWKNWDFDLKGITSLDGYQLGGIVIWSFVALVVGLSVFNRWRNRALRRAFRMAQLGHVDEAIGLVEDLREQNGQSPTIIISLVSLLALQKRWMEVLELINDAMQSAGRRPEFLFWKGVAQWELDWKNDALSSLQQAAAERPSDFTIVCRYGSALAELGHPNEAMEQLRQADSLYAQRRWGVSKDWRTALEELRRKVTAAQASQH
jgi:tetratricopeptide (TPR) repeat protein